LNTNKRYLLYGSERYALAILRPLQTAIRARGCEVAWFFDGPGAEDLRPDESLLRTTAALVRGSDRNTGEPLYGVGPVNLGLEALYDFSDFTAGAHYTHRWPMTRPGYEELRRPSVDLLDLDLRYRATEQLELQLYMRNALDQLYFATADELSAYAQGRSFGFNVVWRAR